MTANRGVHFKKHSLLWQEASQFVDDLPDFDNFIYVHGSTCRTEVGLTMTFAHELQHFVQCGTVPKLLAENTLAFITLRNLDKSDFDALGLRACDIPYEREARIVAKHVAENFFGAAVVRQHIDAKIAEFATEQDAADWDCIRGLFGSTPYDLAGETKLFFPRLRSCRWALERELRSLQAHDPDFDDIDLDLLLSGTE